MYAIGCDYSHLPILTHLPHTFINFASSPQVLFLHSCLFVLFLWPTAFNQGHLCKRVFGTIHWSLVSSYDRKQQLPYLQKPLVQVTEGWGLWYPPLSVTNCFQVILCRPKADNHSWCEIIIAMALSCPDNGILQLAFSIFLFLWPQCSMSFRGIDINVLFRTNT